MGWGEANAGGCSKILGLFYATRIEWPLFEGDSTLMYELVVGLPYINIIGAGDWSLNLPIAVIIRHERPVCCGGVHRDGSVAEVGDDLGYDSHTVMDAFH